MGQYVRGIDLSGLRLLQGFGWDFAGPGYAVMPWATLGKTLASRSKGGASPVKSH